MSTYIDKLTHLNACSTAREWAVGYPTLQDAWTACEHASWMMWLLKKVPPKHHEVPVLALVGDILSYEKNQQNVTEILIGKITNGHRFLLSHEYVKAIAVECLEAWRRNLENKTINELYHLINHANYPAEQFRRFFPIAPVLP